MSIYRKMGKAGRFLKKIVMLTGLVAAASEFFFLGSIELKCARASQTRLRFCLLLLLFFFFIFFFFSEKFDFSTDFQPYEDPCTVYEPTNFIF